MARAPAGPNDAMPTNEHVLEGMRTGITGAITLKTGTPPDIMAWIRDFHNDFHGGASKSFIELYSLVPDCEKSRAAHKKASKNPISRDACPKSGPYRYEKLKDNFIPERFPR